MSAEFVYLASGSSRRRELLAQIGVKFQTLAAPVDESAADGEAPGPYVLRMARAKAAAGWAAARERAAPVLAADTAVVLDGEILLKPKNAADGERMLLALSGRTHHVLTAVCLAMPAAVQARLTRSEVTFRTLDPHEVCAYWKTGEPQDKAGGYAIQGRGAVFVAALTGSYSAVMGLPLYETALLLDAAGVPRWL